MPKTYILFINIVVLIVFGNHQNAISQHFSLGSTTKEVSIHFKMKRDLVIVALKINNQGPFNFILDTGAGFMVITDPNLFAMLNLPVIRTIKLSEPGTENNCNAKIIGPLDVQIPGLEAHNIIAAVLETDQFDLSGYVGMPIHGLLGYEFFEKLAIKLDFTDSTITAYRQSALLKVNRYRKIPITIESNKPYIKASIQFQEGPQQPCKLVVDMGSGHAVLLENTTKLAHPALSTISANLGVGITGPVFGNIGRAASFSLSDFIFKNVLICIPDTVNRSQAALMRDGNFGMELLKRFTVIIDYPDNSIYLKSTRRMNEPFEHDMSGLEYYANGKDLNQFVVTRVEPGSPAEQAGIRKNDEIIAVNHVPVLKLGMESLDHLFKAGDQKKLKIEIWRNNQKQKLKLVLRRRI